MSILAPSHIQIVRYTIHELAPSVGAGFLAACVVSTRGRFGYELFWGMLPFQQGNHEAEHDGVQIDDEHEV